MTDLCFCCSKGFNRTNAILNNHSGFCSEQCRKIGMSLYRSSLKLARRELKAALRSKSKSKSYQRIKRKDSSKKPRIHSEAIFRRPRL